MIIYLSDFIGLYIEPGSRLLFYVKRNKEEFDRYYQPVGSISVINIDTRQGMVLLKRGLHDPQGLAVNTKHGLVPRM